MANNCTGLHQGIVPHASMHYLICSTHAIMPIKTTECAHNRQPSSSLFIFGAVVGGELSEHHLCPSHFMMVDTHGAAMYPNTSEAIATKNWCQHIILLTPIGGNCFPRFAIITDSSNHNDHVIVRCYGP